MIGADEVPILTTSSAELAQQQIAMLNGCTWLPVSWARKKGGLHTVVDSTTLSRPLYAIWLQNSDKKYVDSRSFEKLTCWMKCINMNGWQGCR